MRHSVLNGYGVTFGDTRKEVAPPVALPGGLGGVCEKY